MQLQPNEVATVPSGRFHSNVHQLNAQRHENQIHIWARTRKNDVAVAPVITFPAPRTADLCVELLKANDREFEDQLWLLLIKLDKVTPMMLADAMMRDIVRDRRIPDDCKEFSKLHDYMDANCLGGTEVLWEVVGNEKAIDIMNPAMDIVNEWLNKGQLKCARAK